VPLKLALPGGQLARPVDALLDRAGLTVSGYADGSRSYRPKLQERDGVFLRVFREKDIPIQIALGNYQLGICGLAWVEEQLVRYPNEALVMLRPLPLPPVGLYVAAAVRPRRSASAGLADIAGRRGLRLVSEFADLAEAFALAARLPAYRIFPVWGAAEAYPPEDADLAVVAAASEEEVVGQGLAPLHCLLSGPPWLIAHRPSLEGKDLSPLLEPLMALEGAQPPAARASARLELPAVRLGRVAAASVSTPRPASDAVRLALPDGHQQPNAVGILRAAGLSFAGYDEEGWERRPASSVVGLEVKVIRPHDMPQQVALGNFDLAICGRDCLLEHLYRFPASPVAEAVDLGGGQFDLSAVVSQDLPADSLAQAMAIWKDQRIGSIRVASEFPAIADNYARANHFWRYQVIPIGGASEGFVPEDADLLIEGIQTGRTLAENNLKAIDRFLRSTTCLLAGQREASGRKGKLLTQLMERFGDAAGRGVSSG
jgi:ATP phosphoribosyltransferase